MSRALDVAVTAIWVVGVVLAKGVWSTVAAVCFPPWGWYLIAEARLKSIGWV